MLRPDITEAAARLTSGFDVSRELRQLGAHLREGETVYRLAAGVYGSGGGLMAVTNRRVLLLRDGRTGQASEGFPLARISSVRWVGGSGRGAVVISDAHNTAELGQVEATEGHSVVSFIRSLLPNEPHDELDGEFDRAAEPAALDEDLGEHGGLLTHGDLVLAAAGGGSRGVTGSTGGGTGVRGGSAVGARNGSVNGAVNGSANGSATATATRTGRFAVPMKVRTPPERLGLPEQKSAEPPSRATESDGPHYGGQNPGGQNPGGQNPGGQNPGGQNPGGQNPGGQNPGEQDRGDQDRYGLRDQVAGLDRDRYPTRDRFAGEPVNGQARFAGAEHVDGQARFAERGRIDGRSREDLGRDDYADRDYADRDYGDRDYADREDHADPGDRDYRGNREYSVSDLVEADRGFDVRSGRYPDRDRERDGRDEYPGRERFADPERPGPEAAYGAQSSVPGMPGVEGSGGTLAGEVPVSRLAEETGGTRIDTSGERDRVRRSGEYERAETMRPGRDRVERERPGYDRSGPAEETGELVGALGARRGASPRRGEAGPDGPTSGRRPGGSKIGMPDRKWLLIGGAGVLTLAVIGGVIAATSGDDTPVAPAPAAIESAGPVVKVSKVIDGDTIEVEGSATGQVEIIGITAPRADKEQCGAADATGFATRTLSGSQVTLIADPSQPRLDKSGRRLASVRTSDGLDYATLAAQAGMVRYYEGATPVTQAAEIKAAQADAEKAERGLWGPPCNGRTSAKSSSSTAGSSSGSSSASGSNSTRSSSSNAGSASNAGSGSAGTASNLRSTGGTGSSSTSGNSGSSGTTAFSSDRGNTLTDSGLGN